MSKACGAEAHKPGIVVKWSQRWNDQTNPCQTAADERGHDRSPVPTAAIGVSALATVQVAEFKSLSSDDPVVNDQDSGDRAEPARIANQPRKDVTRWICQQAPWLHQDSE